MTPAPAPAARWQPARVSEAGSVSASNRPSERRRRSASRRLATVGVPVRQARSSPMPFARAARWRYGHQARSAQRPEAHPHGPVQRPTGSVAAAVPARALGPPRAGLRQEFAAFGLTISRLPPGPDTLYAQLRCTARATATTSALRRHGATADDRPARRSATTSCLRHADHANARSTASASPSDGW